MLAAFWENETVKNDLCNVYLKSFILLEKVYKFTFSNSYFPEGKFKLVCLQAPLMSGIKQF